MDSAPLHAGDESGRHEGSGVEHEQIAGGIRLDRFDDAAIDSVLVDDGCADEIVDPELVGVVERLRVQLGVDDRLRLRAIVDPAEANQVMAIEGTAALDDVLTIVRYENRPRSDAFEPIRRELHDDLPLETVGAGDVADVEQLRSGGHERSPRTRGLSR